MTRQSHDDKPLAIDLYSGLGGWSDGLIAEGWRVVGFDIECHVYGEQRYPGQLVLQDVLTLHGSQFRDASLIVASPPCTEYSYMAMPWSRAKQIARALKGQGSFPDEYTGSRTIAQLNALFEACFRIQREASEAAGCYIPMVVENVKGAQPWVGKARANFGSFYLWGDVDSIGGRIVRRGAGWGAASVRAEARGSKNGHIGGGSWFAIGSPGQVNVSQNPDGRKVEGFNFHEHEKTGQPGRSFQSAAVENVGGVKGKGGSWYGDYQAQKATDNTGCSTRFTSSHSAARKAASAQIAKIPFALAQHIARIFKPEASRMELVG